MGAATPKDCYLEFYRAKIAKDLPSLDALLDDSFVLVHMTGMRQNKREFMQAVGDGTLNYYTAQHDNIQVNEDAGNVSLTGQTLVLAAVFGGGKHTWRLQLRMRLIQKDDCWTVGVTTASTY